MDAYGYGTKRVYSCTQKYGKQSLILREIKVRPDPKKTVELLKRIANDPRRWQYQSVWTMEHHILEDMGLIILAQNESSESVRLTARGEKCLRFLLYRQNKCSDTADDLFERLLE